MRRIVRSGAEREEEQGRGDELDTTITIQQKIHKIYEAYKINWEQ